MPGLLELAEASILAPLASAPLVFIAGRLAGRRASEIPALTASLIALASSLKLYSEVPGQPFYSRGPAVPLMPGGILRASIFIDEYSALFSAIVGIVGFLVMLYSLDYMAEDRGYARYYALLTLFIGAMNGLVLSGNLAALYAFWELVGLCSFSLIGHWYHRPRASAAGVKAFIMTRIGDVALLAGIAYLYSSTGSLEYPSIATCSASMTSAYKVFMYAALIGAAAKSAQLPLHSWLPDAMEGPTSVSALIHAATMVKAGVYLLIRAVTLAAIYGGVEASVLREPLLAASLIGGATALYAAISAAAQLDAKRVLAYSTISQLGYIFAAIGLACSVLDDSLRAAIEHVVSHAVFKSLLFLSVGMAIHELEPLLGPEVARDLRYISGIARRSPVLAAGLLAGCLSLIGMPPFGGAWSKEEILGLGVEAGALPILLLLGLAAVFTTIYALKLLYYLVFAEPKTSGEVKTPPAMGLPVAVLSALTLAGPLIFCKPYSFEPVVNPSSMALSLAAITAGGYTAYAVYWKGVRPPIPSCLVKAAREGFYLDQAYRRVVMPAVLFIARMTSKGLMDVASIAVDYSPRFAYDLASRLRGLHRGSLSLYFAAYVLGAAALLAVALISMRGG